jgi:N-acetylglucosaminyldiphosphoundecaprenol N-acetyl-beta-D-mannosaminyltransferase
MEVILGYPVTRQSRETCISRIVEWLRGEKKGKYFVCANPHSIEVARTDPIFDAAIKSASMIIPDGMGIVLASRILGGRIFNRITGSDIFLDLSETLEREGGYSYFFLGSTAKNLAKIRERMNTDFPNITVVGSFSPPFKPKFSDEDNLLMIEEINKVKPDVLWVGMTAPKQEKWIYNNKDRLDVKFIGPIGAVFDFYSGTITRSHPWFQKRGLEWLPRLFKKPRHLWPRVFVSGPKFFLRILRQRFAGEDLYSEESG